MGNSGFLLGNWRFKAVLEGNLSENRRNKRKIGIQVVERREMLKIGSISNRQIPVNFLLNRFFLEISIKILDLLLYFLRFFTQIAKISPNSESISINLIRLTKKEMGACAKSSHNSSHERTIQRRAGNLTYEQYCTSYIDFKVVGDGCRQTPAWKTHLTLGDIRMKRDEYWDTRTSGDVRVWRMLRGACEAPDSGEDYSATAKAMVEAAGMRMPQGSLQLCVDGLGTRYELPVYVINEAEEYGAEPEPPPLLPGQADEELEVVIRSQQRGDVKMRTRALATGKEVKALYVQQTDAPNSPRLFFNGREIGDSVHLAQRRVTSGVVIQAMGA